MKLMGKSLIWRTFSVQQNQQQKTNSKERETYGKCKTGKDHRKI